MSTRRDWSAEDAQRHFQDVLEAALRDGPQAIRRPDGREAVLVSREDFLEGRPSGLEVLRRSADRGGDPEPLAEVLRGQGGLPPDSTRLRDPDPD